MHSIHAANFYQVKYRGDPKHTVYRTRLSAPRGIVPGLSSSLTEAHILRIGFGLKPDTWPRIKLGNQWPWLLSRSSTIFRRRFARVLRMSCGILWTIRRRNVALSPRLISLFCASVVFLLDVGAGANGYRTWSGLSYFSKNLNSNNLCMDQYLLFVLSFLIFFRCPIS